MGEVYRARHTRLERSVAIEILNASVASSPDLKTALRAQSPRYLPDERNIRKHWPSY
jgi:serine/threonine protein kinase